MPRPHCRPWPPMPAWWDWTRRTAPPLPYPRTSHRTVLLPVNRTSHKTPLEILLLDSNVRRAPRQVLKKIPSLNAPEDRAQIAESARQRRRPPTAPECPLPDNRSAGRRARQSRAPTTAIMSLLAMVPIVVRGAFHAAGNAPSPLRLGLDVVDGYLRAGGGAGTSGSPVMYCFSSGGRSLRRRGISSSCAAWLFLRRSM